MRDESIKVVFFGNERLATGVTGESKTLQALLEANYKVVKIFAKDKQDYSDSFGIPVSTSLDMNEIAGELKTLKPDIGVLVAYGLIIPENIIEIFPRGIINIHPSLLPKWRGSAPIEQTILNGDKLTGVSIMKLSRKMDTGPLLAQKKIGIKGSETKQEMADMLLSAGSRLLIDCLADILSGRSVLREQAGSGSYTRKIKKSDGIIDWSKPSLRIEREIRAYAGWPRSRARLGDLDCIITEVEIIGGEQGRPGDHKVTDKTLSVYTKDEALLIKHLQPAGKKEMSAEEFIRGYGSRL